MGRLVMMGNEITNDISSLRENHLNHAIARRLQPGRRWMRPSLHLTWRKKDERMWRTEDSTISINENARVSKIGYGWDGFNAPHYSILLPMMRLSPKTCFSQDEDDSGRSRAEASCLYFQVTFSHVSRFEIRKGNNNTMEKKRRK
jgi:hypothetical protein